MLFQMCVPEISFSVNKIQVLTFAEELDWMTFKYSLQLKRFYDSKPLCT